MPTKGQVKVPASYAAQLRGDNTHEWAQLIQAQLIRSFLTEGDWGKYKWKRMELKLKI